jgi:hypothetical protein
MNNTIYDPYCMALPSKRHPMPFAKKHTSKKQMPSKHRKDLPSHRIDKIILEMLPLFLHSIIFYFGSVILFAVLLIILIVFAYILLFGGLLSSIKI